MKKTLALVAAILFACQISNAQTEKGKQTLGLNAIYTNVSSTYNSTDGSGSYTFQTNKSTTARIGPTYGYFIADGSEIGGSLFYNYGRNSTDYFSVGNNNSNETKSHSYGITAYYRKYVLYKNTFGFRTGPYATYQRGNQKFTATPGTPGTGNSNTYAVGGNFDLVYYPFKSLGVASTIANLSYSRTKGSGNGSYTSNDETFNFNFVNNGLYLTLFYTFGGK
jgi:hypothetical protein